MNTETCQRNFNIDFILLLCAFVGILKMLIKVYGTNIKISINVVHKHSKHCSVHRINVLQAQ
jgi:hypothetical protein